MLIKAHQPLTLPIRIAEKKATKPSTYKERVLADRIAILILLIAAILIPIILA